MKTIGILGGLGPESTAAYYTCITRTYYERFRDYGYPEIVVLSMRFSDFIQAEYDLADRVRSAVERLHRAGADFVVAACNSVHVVYDEIAAGLPIPWVGITDAAAEAIIRDQFTTVGLLGTVFTMRGDFYPKALARRGITALTPPADRQGQVNDIIYRELVTGVVKPESRRVVLGVMEELAARGAQGVVLACTELPFLIRQEDTPIRVYDTTTLHAQLALDLALADDGPSEK